MSEWKASSRIADVVGAVLFLGMSIVAYYLTTTWIPPVLPGDPGAAFFPRIAIGIIVVFCLLLIAQRLRAWLKSEHREAAPEGDEVRVDVRQFSLALISSGLLVAGIAFIGFEPSAFAFLLFLLGLRTGRWLWALITTVIAVVAMYFVFVAVLQVRLPLVMLPKYLDIF